MKEFHKELCKRNIDILFKGMRDCRPEWIKQDLEWLENLLGRFLYEKLPLIRVILKLLFDNETEYTVEFDYICNVEYQENFNGKKSNQ